MAAPGTDKILTHCGVIDENTGKLAKSGRDAFVLQVIALLMGGNAKGQNSLPLSALGVPLPPVGGPIFPAPSIINPAAMEPIFWFGPDPTALLSLPYLNDPNGMWGKIFVDGLYATIAKALDLPGSYVFPVFDPSIYADFDFDFEKDFTGLAVKIPQIITPKFIADLTIKLSGQLPTIDPPAIPPSIPLPPMPPMPIPPPIDFGVGLAFPNFFVDFIAAIPGLVVPQFPPPPSLPGLFFGPITALFDLLLNLLLKLGLILVSPKLLIATMLVIIHNIAVMIACDTIGLILGSGAIVKAIAIFGGISTGTN